MFWPALKLPPLTYAAELVMLILPVAPAALMLVKSTEPGAFSDTLPEVATMPPPKAPMLVPAVRFRLAALADTVLPSLREIWPVVAVISRLPAALMLLAEPLPPKSFTFRSTLRAA